MIDARVFHFVDLFGELLNSKGVGVGRRLSLVGVDNWTRGRRVGGHPKKSHKFQHRCLGFLARVSEGGCPVVLEALPSFLSRIEAPLENLPVGAGRVHL